MVQWLVINRGDLTRRTDDLDMFDCPATKALPQAASIQAGCTQVQSSKSFSIVATHRIIRCALRLAYTSPAVICPNHSRPGETLTRTLPPIASGVLCQQIASRLRHKDTVSVLEHADSYWRHENTPSPPQKVFLKFGRFFHFRDGRRGVNTRAYVEYAK